MIVTLEPEIRKLRAQRYQQMADKNTDDTHDPLKIRVGASTTGDVDLLRLEAEMLAEGRELGNPHIPIDVETLKAAQKAITADGNTPAWTQ